MRTKIVSLFLLIVFTLSAQNGQEAYTFLRLPASPYVSALGGTNISLISTDNANALQNPALLTRSPYNLLSLNYMNYVADINMGSAFYSHQISERGAWGVGMIYTDYGKFTETSEINETLGSFGAKDMALHGIYAYRLSDFVSAGITGKAIYSTYADYSSFALAVDLGINYYNPEHNLSSSIAIKNLGGQLVKFNNVDEKLPLDLQIGLSKKFKHAPFRFHITGRYLTTWDLSLYRETTTGTSGTVVTPKDKFFKTLAKHFIFGLDFLPSDNFYLAFGYNPKTADDFKVMEKKGMYGFTLGTGIKIKRFQIGASIFQQHVGGTTMMIGVSTNLNKL